MSDWITTLLSVVNTGNVSAEDRHMQHHFSKIPLHFKQKQFYNFPTSLKKGLLMTSLQFALELVIHEGVNGHDIWASLIQRIFLYQMLKLTHLKPNSWESVQNPYSISPYTLHMSMQFLSTFYVKQASMIQRIKHGHSSDSLFYLETEEEHLGSTFHSEDSNSMEKISFLRIFHPFYQKSDSFS